MKRLLLLLALCLLVAAPVFALSLNFQNQEENTTVYITNWSGLYPGCGPGPSLVLAERRWVESTDAKNSYIATKEQGACAFSGFAPMTAQQTTYAAATLRDTSPHVQRGGPGVMLLDYGGTPIAAIPSKDFGYNDVGRWEVKIDGDTAYLYVNGVLYKRAPGLTTNPYYIVFGHGGATKGCINTTDCSYSTGAGAVEAYWDDFVYGQSEKPVISGLPESTDDSNNEVVILKDLVNAATKGTAFENNHTIINSNYLYGNWARGNATSVPPDTLENETIQLVYRQDILNNKVVATNYTGTNYYGNLAWDLNDIIFDPGEPYGYYAIYWPDHDYYSNLILYEAGGASITWDEDDYSQGTTATVTFATLEGYWDTSLYTYRASINDVYGVEKTGITMTERTGSFDYTFTSDDDPGVYHAQITATPNTGGSPIWLAVDYAELSEYGVVMGYVNDHLGNTIAGANVNLSQSATYMANVTSGYDGNYTTLPFFITGTELLCDVTASGYRQHYYTILPMSTKTKTINFTLPSNSLSFTGLGIDGVAMEGFVTGIDITKGYGNPISQVTTNVKNATYGDYCTNVSTIAGWYIVDEGNGCFLTDGRVYDVWSEKTGYSNSVNYTVVV